MEAKEKIIVANQKDIESMNAGLSQFTNTIRSQISELKEINSEVFLIKDERAGVIIECQSRKFNVVELANLSLQTLDNILKKRKQDPIPKPSCVT